MTRIAIVCAFYYPEHVGQTIRALDRIRSAVPTTLSVFVANSSEARTRLAAAPSPGGVVELLSHDNSGMEFGAYQAGLDRVLERSDPDWVVFANDTFSTHVSFATPYHRRLVAELARSSPFPAVVGQVEALRRSYGICGLRAHRWITTNLFALDRAAIEGLARRVYWTDVDAQIVETADPEKFFAASLDPAIREQLEAWLFKARPGWHWYGAQALQAANAARMCRKARSILQEKYLSAALEAQSAEFIDLKQLSVREKLRRLVDDRLFKLRNPAAKARTMSFTPW
jgi:hypothetical protein